MKKNLFVVSCLVALVMFVSPKVANAEESIDLNVSRSLTKGAPVIREQLLRSGGTIDVDLGGLKTSAICSKYVIKFHVDSNEKESIFLRKTSMYFGVANRVRDRIFFTKGTETIYESLVDSPLLGQEAGTEKFTLTNYSAKPIKIKLGISSSLHLKSNPCVDYSDIDFNLDNY